MVWLIAIGCAVVAVYFFLEMQKVRERTTDLKRNYQERQTELTAAKAKQLELQKQAEEAKSKLSKLQDEHQKTKERLHQVSQSPKKKGAAGASAALDSEAVSVARGELAEAKAETERWKAIAAKLEAEQKELREAKAAPVVVQEVVAAPAESVDRGAIEREIRETADKKLRAQQIEAERKRKEQVDELAEVTRKLRKSLDERDNLRRRAENNEKAYLITKNELEKMRERLHELDPSVPLPFKAPPAGGGDGGVSAGPAVVTPAAAAARRRKKEAVAAPSENAAGGAEPAQAVEASDGATPAPSEETAHAEASPQPSPEPSDIEPSAAESAGAAEEKRGAPRVRRTKKAEAGDAPPEAVASAVVVDSLDAAWPSPDDVVSPSAEKA